MAGIRCVRSSGGRADMTAGDGDWLEIRCDGAEAEFAPSPLLFDV